ncbi:hypothetical protein IPF08_25200, partial [Escherichia coli]|nr:hypothetical protein [Escherichia coli]
MNFIILFINKTRVVAFSFFIYYVHSLISIIVAIMALGLTGCDDKKAETETPPPANSQPAAPAPEAPVA